MDLSGYTGKLNKSGMPDLRTKEGKDFMASYTGANPVPKPVAKKEKKPAA
jgi:hypothetical protein